MSLQNCMFGLPADSDNKHLTVNSIQEDKRFSRLSPIEKLWSVTTFILGTISLFFVIAIADTPIQKFISPVIHSLEMLQPWFNSKKTYQTFTFAPSWSERKLDLIDFDGLNTLAYFDLPINRDGNIDEENDGYITLKSDVSRELFVRARNQGTKVVLTLTQTHNGFVSDFLSNKDAQQETISQALQLVKNTGTDGILLDFEYTGTNASIYRAAYTAFVSEFSTALKKEIPDGLVAVAVIPGKDNQALYDIEALANIADQMFIMAYTFPVPEQKNMLASAPVFGYTEKTYWKDVEDILQRYTQQISEKKFVMERAWYGNGDNYPFYQSSNHAVDTSHSENTMTTPLSDATINGLVAQVPRNARAAARKNLPAIAEALQGEGILNANVLAYALATIEHETASTFEPIEEIRGRKSARRLGYEGGTNYFGRGFIQLTHLRNYKTIGERIGMGDKLVQNPELASDPVIAAKVLAVFFKDNGVARLASNGRFIQARRPINPDYEGSWIASLAWKYLEMIG